ncbi:MAG: hybrid sensor histidine kinase/response regulator [Campylobacterota bacterium]|nr:hybrid sensor histidine kinase/response regulator [Campylobacterota bacterium]
MINNNINNDIQILIIEESKEYNDSLCDSLKEFGYKVLQAYDIKSTNDCIDTNKEELDLVILNIDCVNINSDETIKYIEKNTNSKIVIISKTEDTKKRENYFKHGILDYHLKDNSIKYISSDINELILRLNDNKKETILLIDDSKVVRYVIKSLLELRNYNVIAVECAKDGIDFIKENDISLLILDMELPDMHGIEVLNLLRELHYINNFPTLVLSGSTNPSIVRQALKKGSSDFLRKPFLFEEFVLKIDLWIKSSKWQRSLKIEKQKNEKSIKSFEALVNSTMEALFIFEQNICIDINDEALSLIGHKEKSDILGLDINSIFKDVTKHHQEQLKDDSSDYDFEDIMKNLDNKSLNIQVKEKNILIGNKILKIVAVMDITQIKQKEMILGNQSKMASMGEMIGNIAHQWRQPLTAISVAAGGIKLNYELDMADEQETIVELDNIVNNTQFLSSTIEDFQNFLKDDRSKINFSIKDTVEKSLSIIKANLESHEINIVQKYNQNIQYDGIQNDLIQVFLNIINNAGDILKAKNNQKKYILIEVDKNDKDIIIKVQDSAGGVPKEIINKVFEPYFTTKHQSQGTGLGLYMTHQIIEKMDGNISVSNNKFIFEDCEYFGATFTITLPLS